jgi:hypothetical protein
MKTNIFRNQINDINIQLFDFLYKLYDFYNTINRIVINKWNLKLKKSLVHFLFLIHNYYIIIDYIIEVLVYDSLVITVTQSCLGDFRGKPLMYPKSCNEHNIS